MDFSHTFVKKIKDGQSGWLDPRPVGLIRIKDDNQSLFYKLLHRKDLKDFKLWYETTSEQQSGNKARLIGQHPEYQLVIG